MTTSNQAIVRALDAREAQLRELLHRSTAGDGEYAGPRDFKDLAESASESEIDQGVADLAAGELAQIGEARRRLELGSYGTCTDCGEPIDAVRLAAMPAALRCVACQQRHERADLPRKP